MDTPQSQPALRKLHRLLVVVLVVVGQSQKVVRYERDRLVWAEAHAAQQRIDRLREMPDIHPHRAERVVGEREVGIEVDRSLCLGQSPLVHTGISARKTEYVVAIRVLVIELD